MIPLGSLSGQNSFEVDLCSIFCFACVVCRVLPNLLITFMSWLCDILTLIFSYLSGGRSEIYSLWGFGSRGLEHKLWPLFLLCSHLKWLLVPSQWQPGMWNNFLFTIPFLILDKTALGDDVNLIERTPPTPSAQTRKEMKARCWFNICCYVWINFIFKNFIQSCMCFPQDSNWI